MNKQFAKDVLEGLNATPKRLSSQYFYDEKGDALFQEIMKLDEYYLTRSEFEIIETNKEQMLQIFKGDEEQFNLIEFGAGDGYKTKVLLSAFVQADTDFSYIPIDISGNVLSLLSESLEKELPDLNVKPMEGEYFSVLKKLKNTQAKNVVLFLGSNIGNFRYEQAMEFLEELYDSLQKGDLVMIGFDLKKDPDVIINAYNDKEGVTRSFNLNLLDRINNELGGNFDVSKFEHWPTYDPYTGTTTSYLVSAQKQKVEIMDQAIEFDEWEAVHMEISQKYNVKDVESMASKVGFVIQNNFYDSKGYFLNSIWKK
ncbi:L-histidine N(alpha)-methyltransferase [Fulvivirga sediminis]|uniref:L-histidine N(Alpha)-methyltransferase n=1 Tax=Fulvivirga sediminis TaxID=2803949 RepID=A0A937F5A7_9BACT|nr:L-histidine N(alpha)-methyltransferase [Fulvivirga sediminis]MBL3656646.1 L-histidine N(alpha)-methyltransferase [Fulvivirga sediminis]